MNDGAMIDPMTGVAIPQQRVITNQLGFPRPRPQGTGVITYPDGATYSGEISAGKRHGQGKLTLPDGLTYVGLWQDGQFNGKGTLTQSNGDRYEGDLVAGRREGKGREGSQA